MTIVCCALAQAALALASLSARDPIPEAILGVAAALGLALLAAAGPRPSRKAGADVGASAKLLMGGVIALQFAFLPIDLRRAEGMGRGAAPMIAAFAVVGVSCLSYATKFLPRWRFPLVLTAYFALGAWSIWAWPRPDIDLFAIQQNACSLLLRGENPYSGEHPGVPWKPGIDAESIRAGDHMRSYAYPPLSLLATLPGYLAGDVRWSVLLAGLGASAFFVAIGRRSGRPAGHVSELAAVGMLGHPWGLMIVYAGYSEPFLALAVAAFALSRMGSGRVGAGVSGAATLCFKQYGFLAALPLGLARRPDFRASLVALGLTALVNVPFVLWDPPAIRLGLIDSLGEAPLRKDSLCLSAMLAVAYPVRLPASLGFVAAAAVLGGVFWRADGRFSRAAAGGAATCLAFFLFGRAGHVNYYWFCSVMLWLAIALEFAENGPAGEGPPATGGLPPSTPQPSRPFADRPAAS